MDSAIRFDRVRLRPRELVPALVCSLGVESGVMSDEGGGAAEGALGGVSIKNHGLGASGFKEIIVLDT